jgi:hypothetical protein
MMFDDSKTMAPEKLQAKVAQRQKLMTQQYAQLPEDEKEKDRVVARAMLQAITGGQQGVAEGSGDLKSELASVYSKLAPKIKRHRDSFGAGQLYDALEAVADKHGAGKQLAIMMRSARNSAHMEYDTNPGGFENWFWFLPFENDELREDAIPAKMVIQGFVVEYDPSTRTVVISKRGQELEKYRYNGQASLLSFQRNVGHRIKSLEDDLYGADDEAGAVSLSRVKVPGRGHGYQELGEDDSSTSPDRCICESTQRLHAGDPIIVTAPNEFEGATGEIYELSPSGKFVIVNLYNHGRHSMHLSDVAYNDYADQEEEEMDEGFQDFNRVEPYAVCLAGKPVKQFDYYEDARRFHDNWKKKLYREGNKAKADKITLMPLNLDEEEQKPYNPNEFRPVGPITIVPPKKLKSGETHQGINDYWKAHGQAPIYKTNEAGSPAQQAAIAIAMKKAGKKPKSVDEDTSPHTVCKRVGGDWITIKQHDSEPQAQRHAQNIKMKYPSMQIGVKTPAGEYRMIGLKENDDDGDYDNDPDPTHHVQVTKKDIQRAKVYPDHVNRAIAKSPKYRDDIIADYECRQKQGVEENILPEPKNEKEYIAQRDKLVRMLNMERNRANVQIIVQAIKDLDRKAKNSSYVSESALMELAPNVKIQSDDKPTATRYPNVKMAMTKYRKEFPGVSDLEAVVGHAYKTDVENARQQKEIDRLQKQEKELYDKIDDTNKELKDKEARFVRWTKKVNDMALTPKQAAKGAADVEAGRKPDVKRIKAEIPAASDSTTAQAQAEPTTASTSGWLSAPKTAPVAQPREPANVAPAAGQVAVPAPKPSFAANDPVNKPTKTIQTMKTTQPSTASVKQAADDAIGNAQLSSRTVNKMSDINELPFMDLFAMTEASQEIMPVPSQTTADPMRALRAKNKRMQVNLDKMKQAFIDNLPGVTLDIEGTPITAYRSQFFAINQVMKEISTMAKRANVMRDILGSAAGWYSFIESTKARNFIYNVYPRFVAGEKRIAKQKQRASKQATLPGMGIKEASMAWAAHKPTGPKFGGYLKGTDPAPTEFSNKGVGGCEEDVQVGEGAKVDRMQKYIAKSERKLGHSKKDAEAIGWATLNKRGYLDNKNKKAHEESVNFMEWTVAQGSRFANFTAKPEVYKAARAAYLKEGMSNALSNISRRMAGPVGAKKIIKNREQLQDKLGRSHFAEEETDPEVERSIAAAKSLPAIDAKISKHQQRRQDLERKMAALDAELARKDQADQEYWQHHAPRATRIKEPSKQLETAPDNKPGWALDPKTRLELKKRQERNRIVSKWAGKQIPLSEETEVDELEPGQYYMWTVYFDDGSSKRIKVTQDTFDPKAFYAKQNRVVVNVKYDWEPHREQLSNIPG